MSKPVAVPFLNDAGYVDFAPDDVANPKNWSVWRRTYVTAVVVLLVTNATWASSAPSSCLQGIADTFRVTEMAASLTITLFLLGYCAGPLVFAPLSEFYGRRYIFWATFTLYLAFNFLCAFAPSLEALLVGRFLTGTFVSAPLSNSPGVLADLWDPIPRGNAMAGFAVMVWAGPALGPVVSGFLVLTESWRWVFYVLLWLGACTGLLMLTIPETYAPVILRAKARRIRGSRVAGYEHVQASMEDTGTGKHTGTGTGRSLLALYRVALTRPWTILLDPISFFLAVYLSAVYVLLYMLFTIYPLVFQQRKHWNLGIGELPLLGLPAGAVIGGMVMVWESHRQSRRVARGHVPTPEDRLLLPMAGGISFAGCIVFLAWTAAYDYIHWIVPTIAGSCLACTMMLISVAYLNYLVDTYQMYAASAIAANTVVRSAAGSAAPLFTKHLFSALGIGGGGSLIGGIGCVLAVIPFIFYRYGERIRSRSPFSPTGAEPTDTRPDDEEKQRWAASPGSETDQSSIRPVAPSTQGNATPRRSDDEHNKP